MTGFALTASRMRLAWALMGSRTGVPILVFCLQGGTLTQGSISVCPSVVPPVFLKMESTGNQSTERENCETKALLLTWSKEFYDLPGPSPLCSDEQCSHGS